MSTSTRKPGRHFLQIPGPTPIPDRVLRAMDYQVLDHRGPKFQELALRVLEKIKTIFKTKSNVIIFPASGSGAWEAAMVAQADASVAAGRLVDEAIVDAWIDSIGTEHELPVPYSGR